MFGRKGFEATVFHEIGKIAQLIEIAGYPIVVANSPQFCIVGRYDFQICETQRDERWTGISFPSGFCIAILLAKINL